MFIPIRGTFSRIRARLNYLPASPQRRRHPRPPQRRPPRQSHPCPSRLPGAPHARDTDSVTQHTDLLSDLVVPGTAGRKAEMQTLRHRAAGRPRGARCCRPPNRAARHSAAKSTTRPCAATLSGASRWPLAGDPELFAMDRRQRPLPF